MLYDEGGFLEIVASFTGEASTDADDETTELGFALWDAAGVMRMQACPQRDALFACVAGATGFVQQLHDAEDSLSESLRELPKIDSRNWIYPVEGTTEYILRHIVHTWTRYVMAYRPFSQELLLLNLRS